MSKRIDVRPSGAGWNYLVQDGDEFLGPFPSLASAFKAVLDRGGRVHLSWERTVIAGASRPKDFTAKFENEEAGRIYAEASGMSEGLWKAFPGGHNRENGRQGGGTQLVDTRDEAVAFIERRFTELMAGVDPKPIPNAYAKAKSGQ
jgi:hypothetical protein